MKATTPTAAKTLTDIPNIGKQIAEDLRALGFEAPSQLAGQDPYALYDRLNAMTGIRHDPCLLDTFIAAVRFMDGEPPRPWWTYTPERKRALAAREPSPLRAKMARAGSSSRSS
jgi:hypothetical protein